MPEQFVAKSTEMKDGERRIVFMGEHEIGVFKEKGEYYAYSNFCLHQVAPVKPERRATPAKAAAKATVVADGPASAQAAELAATIERGLRDGNLDTLTPQAFQTLMAAMCKSYGAQVEAGREFLPLADRQ